MRKLFVLLAAGMLAVILLTAVCGAAPAGEEKADMLLTAAEEEAVALVNAERAAAGLKPLKVNPVLVKLARDYADDMLDRDFKGHYNPEGESPFDRMRRCGISYRAAGENLAYHISVAAAHQLLMASKEGHRENILGPDFTEVGIGVRPGPRGTVYVVQEFVGR